VLRSTPAVCSWSDLDGCWLLARTVATVVKDWRNAALQTPGMLQQQLLLLLAL